MSATRLAGSRPGTARSAARHGGSPPRLELHELSRIRAAAEHARRAVPGPLGELAARELAAHADFGYRGDGDALMPRLARQVLALPRLPDVAA
jgi:hypothetical protein